MEKRYDMVTAIADDGQEQTFSLDDVKKKEPMTRSEWVEAIKADGYSEPSYIAEEDCWWCDTHKKWSPHGSPCVTEKRDANGDVDVLEHNQI